MEAGVMAPSPFAATTMDYQLTLDKILLHAELVHGEQEIVTRRPRGQVLRYSYRDMARRARGLAAGLIAAGLKPGDRVASLMWNSSAHLEAYYGIPCAGGVLHTVNVRFRPEEIAHVIRDAGSRFLIVDDNLLETWQAAGLDAEMERIFVHSLAGMGCPDRPPYATYESLVRTDPAEALPELTSERASATLCYTGGTTGRPKGIVYSHRALILHALAEMGSIAFGYGMTDVVLPAVPMFHVNAWGIPYSAVMAGAKLVLPGPAVDAESLLGLAEGEGVTFMAGVPTIWASLLRALDDGPPRRLAPGLEILTGGAAPHRALVEGLDRHGITLLQGWGMTETSGAVAVSRLKSDIAAGPTDRRHDYLIKQGLTLPIAQLRIVPGKATSDGRSVGAIEVRGTSVTGHYLNHDKAGKWTRDGWFRTGDIGFVDERGYLRVLEREEDLIKSGGEWIVPHDLEDAILECPEIASCAVVARADERWGERPVAMVVLKGIAAPDWGALRKGLEARFPRYWLPDEFMLVDAIPHTSVGKIDRKALKSRFGGLPLQIAPAGKDI